MRTRYRPPRRCAICERPSVNGHFCKTCYYEWKDDLDSDWIRGMIKFNNHNYYLETKESRHPKVSLDRVPI